MMGFSTGVRAHDTCQEIPESPVALEHRWTHKLERRLEYYARPLAHRGAVYTHDRERRVLRVDEHGERSMPWVMGSHCQLKAVGRYILVPQHNEHMGIIDGDDLSTEDLPEFSFRNPCGSDEVEGRTRIVFADQTLVVETLERTPHDLLLYGNYIGGRFYGGAKKSERAKEWTGIGCLDLETGEWDWQEENFLTAEWVGRTRMVVNVRDDDRTIGEVWDRETRRPLWRRKSGFVGIPVFRDDRIVFPGHVIDMETGALTHDFPYRFRSPCVIAEGRYFWNLEQRSGDGLRRLQAIVCIDLEDGSERFRLELGDVGRRSRSDFMYSDGLFFRLLERRLECYGPVS